MAYVSPSRVWETSTSTGTGDFTLAGKKDNSWRSFSEAVGPGNNVYYGIESANEFEAGLGTLGAAGTTLQRTSVITTHLGASNPHNFGAGTKNVFAFMPAERVARAAQTTVFTDDQNLNSKNLITHSAGSSWWDHGTALIASYRSNNAELFRLDGNARLVAIVRSDDSNAEGPELRLVRKMGIAPTANDPLGVLRWIGPDNALADKTYGKQRVIMLSGTPGAEHGEMNFSQVFNGGLLDSLRLRDGAVKVPVGVNFMVHKTTTNVQTQVGFEIINTGQQKTTTDGDITAKFNRKTTGIIIEAQFNGEQKFQVTDLGVTGFTAAHESWFLPEDLPGGVIPAEGTVMEAVEGLYDNIMHPFIKVAQPAPNKRIFGLFLANRQKEEDASNYAIIAASGISRCRVKGPLIENGDWLTMSDEAGVATLQTEPERLNTTIGKALQNSSAAEDAERLVPVELK